ncbi:MAG: DUF748 domain-containing protein [Bacteroidales bacterium]|nr:DUF748 domain-containing protein [Bacteroidales bacterium]
MALSTKQKRWSVIGGIIVGVLTLVVIVINLVLANIINKRITNVLENYPDKNYQITLERVGVNILNGNINLRGLQVEPDSAFVEKLKQGELMQSMVLRLKMPLFRLAGFSLYDALTEGYVDIRKILFKNASVQVLVGKKRQQKTLHPEGEEKREFKIDSIRIKGLKGIHIGKIELYNIKVEFVDVNDKRLMAGNKNLNLKLTGIETTRLQGEGDYFAFNFQHGKLELSEEELKLPGGNYQLSLGELGLDLADSSLRIKDFVLKPQIADRFKMAAKLKYTSGIFNVAVREINVSGIDAFRLIHQGQLFIGHILVSGLDLDIFKDKRKPWDYDKRPKYPHEALRTMDFPLYIGKVRLVDGNLKYWEESDKSTASLTVSLNNMKATMSHVTSVKDSTRKPMNVSLKALVYNAAQMSVDFLLPLNSRVDTFFMSGSLGKARMKMFNPALFPAIGMKIKTGTINSLVFSTRANRNYIDGEMLLLYDGLETEVIKKNDKDVNKFMSWLANSAAHKSNPGKNDRLRKVPMHYDRDMYKGFINLAWKSLQTGLVNTFSPTGKLIKDHKQSFGGTKPPKKESARKGAGKKEKRKSKRKKKKDRK